MVLSSRFLLSAAFVLVTSNHSYANPISEPNVGTVGRTVPNTSNAKSVTTDPEPSQTSLEPNPTEPTSISNVQSRVDVHPSFFYRGMHMVCRSVDDFISGRFRPLAPQGVPLEPVVDWTSRDPGTLAKQTMSLRRRQTVCLRYCRCNDDGVIEDSGILTDFGSSMCNVATHIPEKCYDTHGCTCQADMIQPQAGVPGATIYDYQRALNRVPQAIRQAHPNFVWHGAGRPLRFGGLAAILHPGQGDMPQPPPENPFDTTRWVYYDGATDDWHNMPSDGNSNYYLTPEKYKNRGPKWMHDSGWKYWNPDNGQGGSGGGIAKRDSDLVDKDEG
ncbi:hypothetical protein TWF281_009649 [Arthrobotrys megalospora]